MTKNRLYLTDALLTITDTNKLKHRLLQAVFFCGLYIVLSFLLCIRIDLKPQQAYRFQ